MRVPAALALASAAALAPAPAPADAMPELTLDGPLVQGGLALGRAPAGWVVTLDGAPVPARPDGRFAVGFGRDHPGAAVLRAAGPDGVVERALRVAAREYRTQHLDGLPPRLVSPGAEDLGRIRREQAAIDAARAAVSDLDGFLGPFRWPAVGPITGVYGSRRVLNGEPRQPHYGVDIAAPEGAPVAAPAAGRVVLAEPDLFFSGGTVILDHGLGVSSSFLHLRDIEVAVGRLLAAGERFAAVGSTGRSTGPHLDWRMNWGAARLDPQLLAGPMPAADEAP